MSAPRQKASRGEVERSTRSPAGRRAGNVRMKEPKKLEGSEEAPTQPTPRVGGPTRAERRRAQTNTTAKPKRPRGRHRRVFLVLAVLVLPLAIGGAYVAYKVVRPSPPAPAAPVALPDDIELLLRPGLTLNQIADQVVAKVPGHTKEGFLAVAQSGQVRSRFQPAGSTSLEGLLFPDTYKIGADESDLSIVRKLVNRFDEIAQEVGLGNATRVTPYETIVVASLVETEAKLPEDKAPIAAVVYNRLRDKMALQIDSTLCYAKGGCPPVPTNADKAIDSPYNTYKNAGLPPTPIASAPKTSLAAALAPADVPFKFYVLADANGKHVFATTLAEHDRNVAASRAKGVL